MNLGVVTRSFPNLTNRETAELMAQSGLACTELCFSQTDSKFWIYNGRSDLTEMSDARCRAIVDTYRDCGIAVTALGCFTNLIAPDDTERAANLAYFDHMLRLAAVSGVPYVSTECGFTPSKRGVNTDTYEQDFARLLESLRQLTEAAERHNVAIALEPCVIDIVPSAKRAADLIAQVGSDRLKILLDPANLIANNTEAEMFHHLAPHIAYFHGKDRKVNDVSGRLIGDGDIDWPLFLRLYHRHTEGLPFILEYVKPENFLEIRDRVLRADAAAQNQAVGHASFESGKQENTPINF